MCTYSMYIYLDNVIQIQSVQIYCCMYIFELYMYIRESRRMSVDGISQELNDFKAWNRDRQSLFCIPPLYYLQLFDLLIYLCIYYTCLNTSAMSLLHLSYVYFRYIFKYLVWSDGCMQTFFACISINLHLGIIVVSSRLQRDHCPK